MDRRKSTVDEIRQQFDQEVEVFADLESGQVGVVDSRLAMSLVADAAAATTRQARRVLDVGCGAGNYTLKLLERMPNLDVTLVDLSRAMLDRAIQRIRPKTTGSVDAIQVDVRELELGKDRFDIVLASAVLHHLRTDAEWTKVFQGVHDALTPRGSFWIFDLVESSVPEIQSLHWRRFGEYLTALQGDAFRDRSFDRILKEDTPRPIIFQLDLLREVGFRDIEILHKNSCFAAFGALKR
jgi:tRNA (cmo5U34)-methyltransferase